MKLQIKLKPHLHLLILTKYKKADSAKTYANIIIFNPIDKNDIPLYKHELVHVKQFYRLFIGDFTLFNKCKRELEAYKAQIGELLKLNNYNKNIIPIGNYVGMIKEYCNNKVNIYKEIDSYINLLIYKYEFNRKMEKDINEQ